MKKRLLSLVLCLVMVLSCCTLLMTGCAQEEEVEEEVGKQFDITRERIRQIEAKALRKLRHPSRARHLRGFLN